MLKYWVWLSELKGLRNQTKLALLRRFGDPESIFYADPDELMLTEGADPGQLKLLENHDFAGPSVPTAIPNISAYPPSSPLSHSGRPPTAEPWLPLPRSTIRSARSWEF